VGVTTYVYNDLYRLVEADVPITGIMTRSYNVAGNCTDLIHPEDKVITYICDADNCPTSSVYSTAKPFVYTYDAVGNRAVVTSVTPISVTIVAMYTSDAVNPVSAPLRRTNGRPTAR
jgi:hypothetical protein